MSAQSSLFDDGSRWAEVSADGLYRYQLGRRWDDGPLLGFVMLNPSTGDAESDDPTLRRCMSFARREGAAGIIVANLFAYRTPKPVELRKAARDGVDVVGPGNDTAIRQVAEDRFGVQRVVAAWGRAGEGGYRWNTGVLFPRIRLVRYLFGARLFVFDDQRSRMNPGPMAPHPLYLPEDTPLAPMQAVAP